MAGKSISQVQIVTLITAAAWPVQIMETIGVIAAAGYGVANHVISTLGDWWTGLAYEQIGSGSW